MPGLAAAGWPRFFFAIALSYTTTSNTSNYQAAEAAANPFVPKTAAPSLLDKVGGALGGLLSKATDTALDVAALYAVNKLTPQQAGAMPGSVYPSGQYDPNALAQAQRAATQAPAAQAADTQKMLVIGGIALVGVLAVVMLARK